MSENRYLLSSVITFTVKLGSQNRFTKFRPDNDIYIL